MFKEHCGITVFLYFSASLRDNERAAGADGNWRKQLRCDNGDINTEATASSRGPLMWSLSGFCLSRSSPGPRHSSPICSSRQSRPATQLRPPARTLFSCLTSESMVRVRRRPVVWNRNKPTAAHTHSHTRPSGEGQGRAPAPETASLKRRSRGG